MALLDYTEDFILYRRSFESTDSVSLVASLEKDKTFKAAIKVNRITEATAFGSSSSGAKSLQRIDLTELYDLYIPIADNNEEYPMYDDYVERMKNGEIYRVLSSCNSRKTPGKAAQKFGICTLEKTELPGGIVYDKQ